MRVCWIWTIERGLILYLQFFGLNEAPFSITPDPAFVYLSAAHRDALAHLLYGVGQGGAGGFVQLTGEVGTGKTTLCRCLLDQVPDDTKVALILNPLVTPRELLATLCEELGISTSGIRDSSKSMVDSLNDYLLRQHADGRRVVVVIDEAQNLSPEALEQVRLLTNLETTKDKLLQMVLLGQPELRALLQRQSLRQLSQRITARYHLSPLGPEETHSYVKHRMKVAGARQNPFRRSALRALYQRSGGVPRLINIIADRALVGAYADESSTIGARQIFEAANEVQPSEAGMKSSRWPGSLALASAVAVLILALGFFGLPHFASDLFLPEPRYAGETPQEASSPPPPALRAVQSAEEKAVPLADSVGGLIVSGDETSDAVTTISSLEEDWLDTQHSKAWRAMAELWQKPEDANNIQAACSGLPGRGYSCLRDHGSLTRVQQLGLPVLLVIPGDQSRYLLLRGLTPSGVLMGEEQFPVEVSRAAVEERWLGEFIVPWPQAPGWPSQIGTGESGAAVDIVLEMATFASPPWQGGMVFDDEFKSWLTSFQRRHGLKADGIVGPNTLLYLMAPTITQPRLIVTAEGNS
jgi:general secretion pathway protein A